MTSGHLSGHNDWRGISVDDVRRIYRYDPETGLIFNRANRAIGAKCNDYLVVRIRGRLILAHRVAWVLHHGCFPSSPIDHRNGNGRDNRIANLRLCNAETNAFNKRRQANSSTGIKGVSFSPPNSYRVRVQAFGQSHQVFVSSLEEAREARQRLADLLHGEFARHA